MKYDLAGPSGGERFLFRSNHPRGERVSSRFSSLQMYLISVCPSEPEIGRVPERILPWLCRTVAVEAIHRLHIGFQKAGEPLRRALRVVRVRALRGYVFPISP